jgi:hypothetical protein
MGFKFRVAKYLKLNNLLSREKNWILQLKTKQEFMFYVFLPNKRDIFGTYYSVANAALHLNPIKCGGLSRQEVQTKNLAISRFCNFEKLVST